MDPYVTWGSIRIDGNLSEEKKNTSKKRLQKNKILNCTLVESKQLVIGNSNTIILKKICGKTERSILE